jgi:hypothetical protein
MNSSDDPQDEKIRRFEKAVHELIEEGLVCGPHCVARSRRGTGRCRPTRSTSNAALSATA